MLRYLFYLLCIFWNAQATFAQNFSISPQEALKHIFNDSKEVIAEKKTLSPEQKASIEKKLGSPLHKTEWTFYIARTGSRIDGYALMDHEVGKTEPITFLCAILPNGEIKEVEIIAYRENIGGEVRERPFLKQYEKKKISDPIRTGQDIQNITGATLSARAVSRGVKRAVVIWNTLYGKP